MILPEERRKISDLSTEEQDALLSKIQKLIHESPPDAFKLRREGNKRGETIPGLPYSVIKLFDEYQRPHWFIIDSELGSGATGKVKIAYPIHIKERSFTQREHLAIGDPCVIKISKKLFEPFEIAAERLQEFDVAKTTEGSNLHAYNIVSGIEREADFNKIYFTQELGKGTELLKLIKTGAFKEKSTEEVLKIMRNIAETLASLHSKGIIHRDIKPENILLDLNTGSVKIIDFGSARIHETESDHSGITQLYAAPEIFTHQNPTKQKVSSSQDIFALGAVLMAILYSRIDPNSDYQSDLDYYERCPLFKHRAQEALSIEELAKKPFDIESYKKEISNKTGKERILEETLVNYLEKLTSTENNAEESRKSAHDTVFIFDQIIKAATAEKQRRYEFLEKICSSPGYTDLLQKLNQFELEKKWAPFLSRHRREHLTDKIEAITNYLNELDKCFEKFRLSQNPEEEAYTLKMLREFSFETTLPKEQVKAIRSKQNPKDTNKSETQKLIEKFEWHTLFKNCDEYGKTKENQERPSPEATPEEPNKIPTQKEAFFKTAAYLDSCKPFTDLKKHLENLEQEYPHADKLSQVGKKINDLRLYVEQAYQIKAESLDEFYQKLVNMHPHNTGVYSNLGNDLYKIFHPGEKSRSETLVKTLEKHIFKETQKMKTKEEDEEGEGEGEGEGEEIKKHL